MTYVEGFKRQSAWRLLKPLLPACIFMSLVAEVVHGAGAEAQTAGAQQGARLPMAAATRQQFEIGDKLKVSFYERLGSDSDRWRNAQDAMKPDRSFFLHPELSGDYSVQSDGTISFPVVGEVSIAGHTVVEVDSELAASFEKLLGRPAFVNAALVERSPVYIIGPVKTPGVYKFESGMTVLHAVALAGGFERDDAEKWTVLDALRETGKVNAATDQLKRVLAQLAVFQADLSGGDVAVPDKLVDLVGPQEAKNLIAEEQSRHADVIKARNETKALLSKAVDTAQHELDIASSRIAPLEANVAMRQDRFAGLQTLYDGGRINKLFLTEAEAEVVDSQDRLAAARSDVAKDRQQLVLTNANLLKYTLKANEDLQNAIADGRKQVGQLASILSADTGVLDVLRMSDVRRESEQDITFQIVRLTAGGPRTLAVDGTTELYPGDLVSVTRHRDTSVMRQAAAAAADPAMTTR